MSKRNIIIIGITIVFSTAILSFFSLSPKDSISSEKNMITDDMIIVTAPPQDNIVVEQPEEIKKMEVPSISASEYNNFEKTIDKLIELTE